MGPAHNNKEVFFGIITKSDNLFLSFVDSSPVVALGLQLNKVLP